MTAFTDAAGYFLDDIGGPKSPEMLAAVASWTIHESGTIILGNNPWNLHVGPACLTTSMASVGGLNPSQHLSGATGLIGNRYAGSGDQNVAIYDTLAHGVNACVVNLASHGSDFAHYDVVLAAGRAGDALAFLAALAASAWSAGHYGTFNGGANVLIPLYQKLLGSSTGGSAMFPVVRYLEHFTDPAPGRPFIIPKGTVLRGYKPNLPGQALGPATAYGADSGAHATDRVSVEWYDSMGVRIPDVSAPVPKGFPFLLVSDGTYTQDLVIERLVVLAKAPQAPAPDCSAAVTAATGPLNARIASIKAKVAAGALDISDD